MTKRHLLWLRRGLRSTLLPAAAMLLLSCGNPDPHEGKVVLQFWDKWNGHEAEAMREIVDDFNASQDRIYVEYSSVSEMGRRLMLAIAGGVPPDIAGVWGYILPVYAENNALMPLDQMAAEAGIQSTDYIDSIWELLHYRDYLWALPTTPATTALIYNKKMFRDAGLDPEKPPRSIAELEAYNQKLMTLDENGRLLTAGHIPSEPGWWRSIWVYWFGGDLWDGEVTITANSPENLEAYRWVQSYPERYGSRNLLSFMDGFGNFASPQNPFFTGRVAMIIQGPWIHRFIQDYAPEDFEYGVAPFPSVDPETYPDVAMVETDVMVIPAGAKHPREAFEFLVFANSQASLEKLCTAQGKFSPLAEASDEFYAHHPNPHIREFVRLAKSKNAKPVPVTTTWLLFKNEMRQAFGQVYAGSATPEQALNEVQQRMQKEFDHRNRRWERMKETLINEWENP